MAKFVTKGQVKVCEDKILDDWKEENILEYTLYGRVVKEILNKVRKELFR